MGKTVEADIRQRYGFLRSVAREYEQKNKKQKLSDTCPCLWNCMFLLSGLAGSLSDGAEPGGNGDGGDTGILCEAGRPAHAGK